MDSNFPHFEKFSLYKHQESITSTNTEMSLDQLAGPEKIRNKILKKRIILAEVKVKHKEGERLQQQIISLEKEQERLCLEIKEMYAKAQEIDEWLLEIEYQSLLKAGK